MNMTNKVNIEFLREQLDKALADIEELKDKVRENKNGKAKFMESRDSFKATAP